MIYFNNLVRDLKQKLSMFLIDNILKNTKLPIKKFIYDLVWGLLSTNSSKISNISRSLFEKNIRVTENRLTKNLLELDLAKVLEEYYSFVFKNLISFKPYIIIDESDVIKPYGKHFEGLSYVQDGSKKGRPKEKGWPVTGIITLTDNGYVIPLSLNLYSSESKGYKSVFIETEKQINKIKVHFINKKDTCFVFDRGYDSRRYINLIENMGSNYIIRAKDSRKYYFKAKYLTIKQLNKYVKGKYSSNYTNRNGEKIYAKSTPILVTHKDIKKSFTLVLEFHGNEKEPRAYITNKYCDTKTQTEDIIKGYRKRWKVEEFYRFIKQVFNMEGFMIRSIKAINNLLLCIMISTSFLTLLINENKSLYKNIIEVYQPLTDLVKEEEIRKEYGYHGLMLYRTARGVQIILGHAKGRPTIPHRKKKIDNEITLF